MIPGTHDHPRPVGRLPRTLVMSTTLVALAAGCTAEGADVPVEGTAVSVVDNDFEPASLLVAAGDTVTWTWEGSRDHNVVGDGFESETQTGGTFTHTFEQPGTYPYACTLHGGMQGDIVVTD